MLISSNLSGELAIARQISIACQDVGFFYVINHGEDTFSALETAAHNFFSTSSNEERERISMKNGGKAWRGYFRVGEEFTSGLPDQKEGLYFGSEDADDDPRFMHGPNLWPTEDGGALRIAVERHTRAMRSLGERLAELLALALVSRHCYCKSFINMLKFFIHVSFSFLHAQDLPRSYFLDAFQLR